MGEQGDTRGSFIIRGEERGLREHTTTVPTPPRPRWRWKAAALEVVEGHPRGTIGFGGDPEAEYTDTSARLILSRHSNVRLAPWPGDRRVTRRALGLR